MMADFSDELLDRYRWLERLGFKFDPFAYEAADEIEDGDPYLDRYFVVFPYFEDLKAPRTSFLFTRRGCGKSANCIQLARYCANTLRTPSQKPNVLAVRYDNFLSVLNDVSLRSHCEAILRQAIPALLKVLFRHFPGAVEKMPEREYESLSWFVQKYSDFLIPYGLRCDLKTIQGLSPRVIPEKGSKLTRDLTEAVASLFKNLPANALTKAVSTLAELFSRDFGGADFAKNISPFELMSRFAAVARAMSIDHVFVLVDRVDEFYGTAGLPERQVELLRPLVTNVPLLNILCFKFFLPSELYPVMQRQLGPDGFREDKLLILMVEWTEKDIAEVLKARLRASNDSYTQFNSLVDFQGTRWDVDARIVKFAHHSPRDLVRIGNLIFSQHTRLPTKKLLLDDSEVKGALRQFSWERTRYLYGDEDLAQLIRIPKMPFTVEMAAQALKRPQDEARALIRSWQKKGLVNRQPRDPTKPDAAPLFDIADPRAQLVWEEEVLP